MVDTEYHASADMFTKIPILSKFWGFGGGNFTKILDEARKYGEKISGAGSAPEERYFGT